MIAPVQFDLYPLAKRLGAVVETNQLSNLVPFYSSSRFIWNQIEMAE